jgi:hypothetical protein
MTISINFTVSPFWSGRRSSTCPWVESIEERIGPRFQDTRRSDPVREKHFIQGGLGGELYGKHHVTQTLA